MPEPTLDWRTREAIREEVKQGVADAFAALGISNRDETRRDLDYLAELRRSRVARQGDAARTMWQVVGGVVLTVLGFVAANLGFKGGHP